jgi:hypothetical protein
MLSRALPLPDSKPIDFTRDLKIILSTRLETECGLSTWRGQIVFRFLLTGFLSKFVQTQWVLEFCKG